MLYARTTICYLIQQLHTTQNQQRITKYQIHSQKIQSYFLFNMKTSRTMSMHRTETMPISLPKISKLNVKESRYNQANNRSSFHIATSRNKHSQSFLQQKSLFTTRVEKQVLDEQEYPYIETSNIERQQSRLKDLLKQFNQQTVSILQKYVIDRPVKKQFIKKRPPVEQIYFIRDKESQNSTNVIYLLRNEIQKLQGRCENLKYMSKEQFEHRIKELKQEKQKIIMGNKQTAKQITLNGLEMVRGKESLVKELQYDQFLIDTRRDRLRQESQRVTRQMSTLQQKIKQINLIVEKYEQEQSYTLKQYEELERDKAQGRLDEQYAKRKKLYQHSKIITQSTNYQLKHRYFQKLKQLDETTNREDDNQKTITEMDAEIQRAKQVIAQLEVKQQEITIKSKAVRQTARNFAKINLSQTVSVRINVDLG